MIQVKIIRSARRKKTVQAKKINDTLQVYLPIGLNSTVEKTLVEKMVNQWENHEQQHLLNTDRKLEQRAEKLNKQFFNGTLKFSIHFVSNQKKRFGSCSIHSKMIRISDRIGSMPKWVQDYVIMHELTHLVYPDHSSDFWIKVNEYSLTERARGYLIAAGLDDEAV
jgi:predicted metal-dependent hydrolase